MHLGLRAKFLIVTVLIVVVVDLAAGVYLQWKLHAEHQQRVEIELLRHARSARELLRVAADEPVWWTIDRVDPVVDRVGSAIEQRVTVIDGDGVVLGDSSLSLPEVRRVENHGDRPEVGRAGADTCGLARRYSETIKTDMLYCALTFEIGEGVAHRGYVRVATPVRKADAAIQRTRLLLVFGGLLSLALALGSAALASRALFGKVRELMEAARAMAEGNKDLRLPVAGTDEFGGLAGSLNKVSEALERTVKELAAERDLFEAVIHSMHEAVLAVDRERRIIALNKSARELLDIQAEARGRLLLEMVRIPQLSETLDDALRGESRSVDVRLTSGASVRHLMVRATPQGEWGGAVLVMHDVTEVRRLETVRRDFVANVSHELRTPVSIIQANTETLLAGALEQPEQARRFLEAVRRNADRLGQLISDLLDISRIEAGKYRIEPRPILVSSVAQAVAKAVSEACRQRSVRLKIEIPPELSIHADASALEQVLINLVENAVKYGPEGGTIELGALDEAEHVRVEVRDEGPGIAPGLRRRVFERFYRVDPGRSRHMGGTGLGLAIVKNLSEAMGAEVGFDPREPHGSIFWVRLPKAESA